MTPSEEKLPSCSVKDAGAVIVWQEDPDGLRPGSGDGPGEGWSGATAGSKTDIWYSFINWEYFDLLENPDDIAMIRQLAGAAEADGRALDVQ